MFSQLPVTLGSRSERRCSVQLPVTLGSKPNKVYAFFEKKKELVFINSGVLFTIFLKSKFIVMQSIQFYN